MHEVEVDLHGSLAAFPREGCEHAGFGRKKDGGYQAFAFMTESSLISHQISHRLIWHLLHEAGLARSGFWPRSWLVRFQIPRKSSWLHLWNCDLESGGRNVSYK